MKNFFKALILNFIYFLFYLRRFKTIEKFKQINKKLEQKIKEIEVERIILKGQILLKTRKFLRLEAKSKYIPKDYKNNSEIILMIKTEFGQKMSKLGIKIKDDLTLA